jgi:propionyl-CoA carboxylase beta chain
VSVVIGNAYGAAFTLLGSRAQGADLTLALPESCISAMDPAAAVAFLYNDEITQDKSRAEVEAAYKATKASAQAAAEKGDIDDIVPAEELRARICAALYMLGSKADGALSRRHANLPL